MITLKLTRGALTGSLKLIYRVTSSGWSGPLVGRLFTVWSLLSQGVRVRKLTIVIDSSGEASSSQIRIHGGCGPRKGKPKS